MTRLCPMCGAPLRIVSLGCDRDIEQVYDAWLGRMAFIHRGTTTNAEFSCAKGCKVTGRTDPLTNHGDKVYGKLADMAQEQMV